MKNGHVDPEQSPFAHLAEHGPPTAADVLEFAANIEKVRAIINTGAFDEFSDDEKLKLAWGIVQSHGIEELMDAERFNALSPREQARHDPRGRQRGPWPSGAETRRAHRDRG